MNQTKEYRYPNNSNSSVIWEIIWPLLVYLLTSVVAGAFIGIFGITVLQIKDYSKFLDDNILIMNIISQIIALIIFITAFKKRKKYIPKEKITMKKDPQKTIIYILAAVSTAILSGFAAIAIEKFVKVPDGGINTISEMIYSGAAILSVITVVILAPILEEIIFRGIIFNKLNSKMNTTAAIIISALVFGIFHMNIVQGLNAFVIGIVLAFIYAKTHNLYTCISIHFINNLLSVITQRINYAVNGAYTSDTLASVILQVLIIAITMILIITNKQVLKEK